MNTKMNDSEKPVVSPYFTFPFRQRLYTYLNSRAREYTLAEYCFTIFFFFIVSLNLFLFESDCNEGTFHRYFS